LLDQAMVGNENTPPDLIRTIASHTTINSGMIDRSLAGNPATPRDILARIADTDDIYALRRLLANSALDCDLLRTAETHIDQNTRMTGDIASSDIRIAALEAKLCAAK
jgi:hypothetical protein